MKDNENHSPHGGIPDSRNEETFQKYMGDESAWAGLVESFWMSVPDSRNMPVRDQASGTSQQIWTAILHLLFLGLGWKNPGAGLERWRKSGYESGVHPVLDLVWDIAGNDLIALEIFLRKCSLKMDGNKGPLAFFETETDDGDFESWFQILASEQSLSKLGRDILPMGGWDPLHLSTHLQNSFQRADSSIDIKKQSDRHFTLVVHKYAGWSNYLDLIPNTFTWETHKLTEITVGVKVIGMSKLGDFRYSDQTRGWSLVGYEDSYNPAHSWGNTQTYSQSSSDKSRPEDAVLDSQNSGSEVSDLDPNLNKKLSILVREEVGLAHTLESEVSRENGKVERLFYKNKGWESGAEWENNRHHNECLLALIQANLIDPELMFAEVVMEGSLVLEVQTWAHELAPQLWTVTTRFPHFIAEIMTYESDRIVSVHELEPHLAEQAIKLRELFLTKVRRAKEQIFMAEIEDFFGSGTGIQARVFLEGLVIAYEYFGD